LEQAGIRRISEVARITIESVMDQLKGKTNAKNVKLL
jgi:hypothetical protein